MNYLTFLVGAYLALANTDMSSLSSSYNLSEWESFKELHGKSYETAQIESIRRMIYFSNKQQVEKFQASEDAEMFQLKLNQFADESSHEMDQRKGFRLPVNMLTGSNELPQNTPEEQMFLERILNDTSIEVPDELDWRKVDGRVSEVKNQGECGSCWAFASTGVLEGQMVVRNSSTKLKELSEQNLVDCDKVDHGCLGGFMKDALNFVKTEGGLEDEESYPYEAKDDKCRFQTNKVAFTDKGAAVLPVGDEQKLKEVVAKFGPVAVAIDASSLFFQFYHGGVYVSHLCGKKENQLDHAVLVVGYGTDAKKRDYWIVKNSWGARWGDHGYILMARNRKNMCGIATVATIPTF